MEVLEIFFGGGVGAGIMAIVWSCLQRKWNKDDKNDAIVAALKVLMIDRVRQLSKHYIAEGEVDFDDKDMLADMHAAYKALGGNGHLDQAMKEVDKLKVK